MWLIVPVIPMIKNTYEILQEQKESCVYELI